MYESRATNSFKGVQIFTFRRHTYPYKTLYTFHLVTTPYPKPPPPLSPLTPRPPFHVHVDERVLLGCSPISASGNRSQIWKLWLRGVFISAAMQTRRYVLRGKLLIGPIGEILEMLRVIWIDNWNWFCISITSLKPSIVKVRCVVIKLSQRQL